MNHETRSGAPAVDPSGILRMTLLIIGVPMILFVGLLLWSSALSLDQFPLFAQLAAYRVQVMATVLVTAALLLLRPGRRRVWGIGLVVLALSPLPQVLPRAIPDRGPTAATELTALTVLSVNVGVDGAATATVADLAIARRADVVALPEASADYANQVVAHARAGGIEYSSATDNPLVASPWEDEYTVRSDGPFPTSLLVRRELLPEFDVRSPAGRLGAVTAVVHTASGRLNVSAVHPTPPLPGGESAWWVDHDLLAELCAATEPTILAGDFNSTLDHSPMRSLLDKGCTDAAEATGKGLRGTWPAAFPWPLTIPIDHVLLNRRAGTVTGFEVLDIGGTDHRGLVAVIAP